MTFNFLPEQKNRQEFNKLYNLAIAELKANKYPVNDDFIRDMHEHLAIKYGIYPPYWLHKITCNKCGIVPAASKDSECSFCNSEGWSQYQHDKFHREVQKHIHRYNIKGTPKNLAFVMLQIYQDNNYDVPELLWKIEYLWASVNKKTPEAG